MLARMARQHLRDSKKIRASAAVMLTVRLITTPF